MTDFPMHEVLVLASNYDTGKPRWVEIYIQCEY